MYVLKDLDDDTYITALDGDDGWDWDDDPKEAMVFGSVEALLDKVAESARDSQNALYGYTIVKRVPAKDYEEVVL